MANQIQTVIYEGYLADAPELRYTSQGKPVANFRMGSNRSYTTADGTVERQTTWLKISCWNKLAEIVNQYCDKGSHVIVIGTLRPNKNGSPSVYQLKSGDWAASFEITAEKVRILKGKSGDTTVVESEMENEDDTDIPF